MFDKNQKLDITLSIIGVIITLVLILGGLYKISKFFDTHTINYQYPISVHITYHKPIYFTPRVVSVNQTIVNSIEKNSPLTPDQQYVCDKFGKDCNIALAIFRAESGFKHDAININSNGTVDFGCFQINSIHLKNIDTTNINLLNCKDNIDIAYKIYTQWKGFKAWSAFNNGAYKKYLW